MTAMPLTEDTVLVRPSWSRLRYCPLRGQWLLLVPERVLFPCPTTVEILTQLAEPRPLGRVVAALAEEYDAPADVIRTDVVELIGPLVEKGYVRRADA